MADQRRFFNEPMRSNSRINGEVHRSLQLLHPSLQDEEEEGEYLNYFDDDDQYENAEIISSSNDFPNAAVRMYEGSSRTNPTRSRSHSRRNIPLQRTTTRTSSNSRVTHTGINNYDPGMQPIYPLMMNPLAEPTELRYSVRNIYQSTESDDNKIDYRLYATNTKIIFEKREGFEQAIRAFKSQNIYYDFTRRHPDIWYFCLQCRGICFRSQADLEALRKDPAVQINSILLSPNEFFRKDQSYWLAFGRQPSFKEKMFNENPASCENSKVNLPFSTTLDRIKFYPETELIYSYGALTSINTYHYHPKFLDQKMTKWNIEFRSKEFRIERFSEATNQDYSQNSFISSFRADLIDRVAVFNVNDYGFQLFILIKGNPREYSRRKLTNQNKFEKDRWSWKIHDCPIFSTVCLDATAKKRSNDTHRFYASLNQIKCLFKRFIEFFYSNRIIVCFGSIRILPGNQIDYNSLTSTLATSIQKYALSMLAKVGYGIEHKLSIAGQSFVTLLLESTSGDEHPEDKFYRLCLYLFRRSNEFHFLSLNDELEQARREYQDQLEQCKALHVTMATILSPPRSNYAYVPSIRITPNTIQIQPLKLVKLHRVLRERNANDPMSMALVEIRDEANQQIYAKDFQALRDIFRGVLLNGIEINGRCYRYLHHSMSQVKEKQFWFLDDQYSLPNVIAWMGNFDNERVVAKHTARMAQCFTSTERSIRIPAEHVEYIPDIESEDKQYCFTDGVGVISQKYGKQVQKALNRRSTPSVLQIRYGGCKGTLSVDPMLDDKPHQMIIRHSMLKFTTDHDYLEICKVSSPRALNLNRQDILLLSCRGIPDSEFLVLQNENHLWLVQALLSSTVAFELLQERLGSSYFDLREVSTTFNMAEEPFFLQLLITCGHDCTSQFQRRAKIKVDKNKARNMFGTVDEYRVLNPGEVFIQFSHLSDEKLDVSEKSSSLLPTILDNVKVAITKNPCHHPGDLRTFIAVDRPELRHLVDVVVFPQKGTRPHPNEISGSDLDGDEYAVIWDPNLVPETENDRPYDYDSQEKPIQMTRPIERSDIVEVVLDIAAQNLTGDMSNLHLAIADFLDPRHPDVIRLAGLISQELDAPKTGKHPITNEELYLTREKLLPSGYPDFMMKETWKSYPSEKVIGPIQEKLRLMQESFVFLGQLYRSARRAIIRWYKASKTHFTLRHLQQAQSIDEILENNLLQNNRIDQSVRIDSTENITATELSICLDTALTHPLQKNETKWAKVLFNFYCENLRNIISIFNYQDEIDLFCRCETLDQTNSKKFDLNISASVELQRLIETIQNRFSLEFDRLAEDPTAVPPHQGPCTRDRSCANCQELKLARAAACYSVCYQEAAERSTKSRSKILSFPWLFGRFLTELKRRNKKSSDSFSLSKNIVVGRAMRNIANRIVNEGKLKLKILWPIYSEQVSIFLRSIHSSESDPTCPIRRQITEKDREISAIDPSKILFIEIINYWIERQNIFGSELDLIAKKPLIREICWHQLLRHFVEISSNTENLNLTKEKFEEYRIVFQKNQSQIMMTRFTDYISKQRDRLTSDFDDSMYHYFILLIRLSLQLARNERSHHYAHLADYLILGLQTIGIEKDLNDLLIDIESP